MRELLHRRQLKNGPQFSTKNTARPEIPLVTTGHLVLRRMGFYFSAQLLHEHRMAPFHPINYECNNRLPLFETLAFNAAGYWHALPFTPEETIPELVEKALTRFGVTHPSHEHIVMIMESFLAMMKQQPFHEGEKRFALNTSIYTLRRILLPSAGCLGQ